MFIPISQICRTILPVFMNGTALQSPNISHHDAKHSSPQEPLDFWQQHFQQDNGLGDTFTAILDRSIGVHNPRYLGHQVSTVAPIASIAGMMVDLLSNGMMESSKFLWMIASKY